MAIINKLIIRAFWDFDKLFVHFMMFLLLTVFSGQSFFFEAVSIYIILKFLCMSKRVPTPSI